MLKNNKKIKRFNNKPNTLTLMTIGIIVLLSICCINKVQPKKNNSREVIIYSHCYSKEATSDVLYSIDQVKNQLAKKH